MIDTEESFKARRRDYQERMESLLVDISQERAGNGMVIGTSLELTNNPIVDGFTSLMDELQTAHKSYDDGTFVICSDLRVRVGDVA